MKGLAAPFIPVYAACRRWCGKKACTNPGISGIIKKNGWRGWDTHGCRDDGIDYFAYAECLNDLVRTEHLRLTEDGCYAITPKGLKNSEICESSLPYSVRLRTDKNVAEYNRRLLRRNQVQSQVTARENGSYVVELRLRDDVDSILHLELTAATEAMARDLADRFRQDPEGVYTRLLSALYPPAEQ